MYKIGDYITIRHDLNQELEDHGLLILPDMINAKGRTGIVKDIIVEDIQRDKKSKIIKYNIKVNGFNFENYTWLEEWLEDTNKCSLLDDELFIF